MPGLGVGVGVGVIVGRGRGVGVAVGAIYAVGVGGCMVVDALSNTYLPPDAMSLDFTTAFPERVPDSPSMIVVVSALLLMFSCCETTNKIAGNIITNTSAERIDILLP